MRNRTTLWMIVILVIAVLSGYIVLPLQDANGNHPGLPGRTIAVRPGLDIQGGLRALLAAESAEPVSAEQMDETRIRIQNRVNALGLSEPVVQQAGTNRIIVELPGVTDSQQALDIIQQTALLEFVNFSQVGGCTAPMPTSGQYITTSEQARLGRGLPGEPTAPAQATAEATLEATAAATLEGTREAPASGSFKPLPQTTPEATVEPESTPEATTAATTEATAEATAATTAEAQATVEATPEATPEATSDAGLVVPPDETAQPTPEPGAPGSATNRLLNPCTGQPFETVMTGAGLETATSRIGGAATNEYVVSFTLRQNEDGQRFATHTSLNVGQPLAIVLDGQVLSAPVIQQALTTGGEITGGFTQQAARNLAIQLRSGALPVSLVVESLEQVGASLGAESVEASVRAGVLGVLVILAFLLIYYRIPGLAAAIALLLFALINFALYKYIPVTLTLSAITGFLISIGSAVDGNILIFERMKEELRLGKPLLKAIDQGFSRAWPSIRESNLSTIMIALILYFFGGQFGASAVRGFSITLIIGLITNLFTVLVVTRTILTLIVMLGGERMRRENIFGR
jgi:protein-export membrane protein SecD